MPHTELRSPSFVKREFDSWLSPLESPSYRQRSSQRVTPQKASMTSPRISTVDEMAALPGDAGLINYDMTEALIGNVVQRSEDLLTELKVKQRAKIMGRLAKLDGEVHG